MRGPGLGERSASGIHVDLIIVQRGFDQDMMALKIFCMKAGPLWKLATSTGERGHRIEKGPL